MSKPAGIAAFADLVDLAQESIGGRAVACSDDFFASMHNLLAPGRGTFDPSAYGEHGKIMDGWESRRKRVPGHDWCIIKLGVPGVVRAVDIDTNHFLGNHPPYASLEGCNVPGDPDPATLCDEVTWTEVVPQVGLAAGSQNLLVARATGPFTHVRLNIFPDGGVARLKVYGEPVATPADGDGAFDLAASANGGLALCCSDMFFSSMQNLIAPGSPATMGEGWETRRRRGPGHDWIVVRLATAGLVDEIEIDTMHFKGNYPDRASVEGIAWPGAPPADLIASPDWTEVIPSTKLAAHRAHRFADLRARGPFTHVRLNVFPCGGVARLRVRGTPAADLRGPEERDALAAHLDGLSPDAAREALAACCGSRRWVDAMVARRPFGSRAAVLGEAERIWWSLGERDWREAFSHHPRIGEDVEALRARFAATADWSAAEQAGVAGADEATLAGLAEGNRAYHERFGFIFIVCATGKSAAEMLALLRERLDNEPAAELRVAAGEQAKITRLRLEKLS